ncbi:hypothetical protein F5Y13DRAFT_188287 [Hypoxylon sp. FL1857]|nr:hypothetical protein F5Y13DRAFT_188287 [Hypoxylon sp. FL1857]
MGDSTNGFDSLASESVVVEDSNLNPVIQLTTWLLLSLTTLAFSFRLLTRFFIKGEAPFSHEDALIVLSYVFCFGESITMVIPESRIIGRDAGMISDDELKAGLKVAYSRDILFVLSLMFAKLSVCASLFSLSPNQFHRRATRILSSTILLWAITCLLSTIFQCGTHGPWENDSCMDWRTFLYYEGLLNAFTDVILVIVPIAMIYPLHMSFKIKVTIMFLYSARLLTITAIVCQLIYLPRLFEDNFTLRGYPYFLCMQLVQFTSFSSACAVYFLLFLRSLQSGFLQASNSPPFTSANLSASSYIKGSREGMSIMQGSCHEADHRMRERTMLLRGEF